MFYDYETAQKQKKRLECASCGHKSRLDVRFFEGKYDLYCPVCRNRDNFKEIKSLTQMWKEDPDSVPLTVANKLERKFGGSRMSSTELALADERRITERLGLCQWAKDMTPQQRTALAQLAITYRLDPLMGELIWYEGAPYITVEGRLRKANETPGFEGIEARPMTQDERELYGVTKPVVWICKVYKAGMRVPAVGIGEADPDHPWRSKYDDKSHKWVGGNFVERESAWRMARSRARRDAIKQYFPHNLPIRDIEEVGEFDADSGRVYKAEAEIIEGESRVVTEPVPRTHADDVRDYGEEAVRKGDEWLKANFPEVRQEQKSEAPTTPIDQTPPSTEAPYDAKADFDSMPSASAEKVISPHDEARERIENLLGLINRTVDEDIKNYFRLKVKEDWDKATVAGLDKFAEHIGEVIKHRTEQVQSA